MIDMFRDAMPFVIFFELISPEFYYEICWRV